jgi:hypothetical protein
MHRFPLAYMIELDVQIAGAIATANPLKFAEPIGPEGPDSIKAALKLFRLLGAEDENFVPETFNLAAVIEDKLDDTMMRGVAVGHLSSIHNVFRSELAKKGCFLLSKDEMAFVDQPALFGQPVVDAFPSPTMDVREAGNCFAAGRYNASAYHCVQAAEIGLRELARDRRVDPMTWKDPKPLEHTQWGHLLGAIKAKIDKIKGWPHGRARDIADTFYLNAFLDLSGINDGWRRHLAHARGHQYERDDIIGLMSHTRRVLQSLARRLGESRPVTREVWKSVPKELS